MRPSNTYITWLNYLGGFEYFLIRAKQEYGMDIEGSGTTKNNLLPDWPKSYGSTANTIEKSTFKLGKGFQTLKTQHLTLNQVEAMKYIKTSPIVQIVTSRNDRLTVLVDSDSFKTYTEDEKVYTLVFKVRYTNNVAAQRL